MKRKQLFLRAAQTLASANGFRLKTANRRSKQNQPPSPEDAGGEMQERVPSVSDDLSAQDLERGRCEGQLSLGHALRIQSAHFWLELGEVNQALLELGALSTIAFNHPSALRARVAVLRTVRTQGEAIVQQ